MLEDGTYEIDLSKLHYPIFKIGTEKPITEGNVTFFIRHTVLEDDSVKEDIIILDDKNIPSNTLAGRRLKLLQLGVKLKQLKSCIYFLGDLIKIAKSSYWFIDNNGQIFKYKKQRRVKLVIKKITKVIPIKGLGAIIEVEGLPNRFKSLFMPNKSEKYAGILLDGISNIFYGFYKEKYDDTWRMI